MKIRTKTAFLTSLALAMLAVSSNAAIIIADTFSFSVFAANSATYSTNPGADAGGTTNFTADSPLTITTGGFEAIGSKLVAVLSLHNSGVATATPTSITYGGATMNIVTPVPSSFSQGYILYLDNVATDGNFVVNFSSGQIDQIGVALFALNGAANGTASYAEKNTNANALASFGATAGDFILATGQRNNGTATPAGTGYTGVDLSVSFLKSGVAYQIAATTDTYSAPTFTGTTASTNGASNEQIALFAAAPIPEPSSLILTAVGGLFLIRRRR